MIRTKMDDPFLDDDNGIHRLLEEWKTHGKLIIAFDFDNTIYDYYKQGIKFPRVIQLLKNYKAQNLAYFTCFTSCDESRFEFIKEYCIENEIPLDAINESPDFIEFTGRKVYYNVLLDDRAGLLSAYQQLNTLYYLIMAEKESKKWGPPSKFGY